MGLNTHSVCFRLLWTISKKRRAASPLGAAAGSVCLPGRNELEIFHGDLLEESLVLALRKRPQDRRGLLAGVPVFTPADPHGTRKGGAEAGEEFLGRGDR